MITCLIIIGTVTATWVTLDALDKRGKLPSYMQSRTAGTKTVISRKAKK